MPRDNRTPKQLRAEIRQLKDQQMGKDNAAMNAEIALKSAKAELETLRAEFKSRSVSYVKAQDELNERFGERVARLDSDLKFVIRERDEARAELQLVAADTGVLQGVNDSLGATNTVLVDDNNALLAANTRLLAVLVSEQDSTSKLKAQYGVLDKKYKDLTANVVEAWKTYLHSKPIEGIPDDRRSALLDHFSTILLILLS